MSCEVLKKDQVAGASSFSFTGASINSRTILPGQLFVALKGQHTDGHKYVPGALARGAAAALVSTDFECSDSAVDERFLIRVPDPLEGLQRLAHDHRLRFRKTPVVAVTGSTGKTTTKDMIATVLSGSFSVLKTEGNLNNHIGLPLTLLGMTKEHTAAVVEMGMSAEGEIRELARIALPDAGVITNVGPVHLAAGLDGIDSVLRAKLELLDHLQGPLVINADCRLLAKACQDLPSRPSQIITYGIDAGADLRATDFCVTGLQAEGAGIRFLVEGVSFRLAVPGRFNVSNALAAVAVGRLLGVTLKDAAQRLAYYHGAPMRFEVLKVGSYTVIDDTYNANPMSVKAALAELSEIGKEKTRKVAVLGDMLELGADSASYHKAAGRFALEYGVDVLIAVGPLMREAAMAFGSASVLLDDSKSAAENICNIIKPGDCILVKGSRGMAMETVVKRIQSAV